MAITKEELESILRLSFPDADILLHDMAGDQDHYSLEIKDRIFKSNSIINQHKLVKEALKKVLDSKLHAITIKTIVKE